VKIFMRSCFKIILNFRFGFSYGLRSARYNVSALNDFFFQRMGFKNLRA
jgi:hypothetical protein